MFAVMEGDSAYLADIDEATHEVPVAHGVDGVLGLVLGRVLNNTASLHPSKPCVNQNPRAKRSEVKGKEINACKCE